ncbi:MAG: hypothetical protein H6613_20160 [Ignavibacteriales bacterium]|nr:hypothetical protein [Ignavibacteriales bacterium]
MITLTKIFSYTGLLLTILPSLLVFANMISLDTAKIIMLVGTIVWFIFTPSWMNKNS